jgi:hypothetical protein
MDNERYILEKVSNLEGSISAILFEHFSNMKVIKKDMTNALDILDTIQKEKTQEKKLLRKKILDNYNDLIRENLILLEEIVDFLEK